MGLHLISEKHALFRRNIQVTVNGKLLLGHEFVSLKPFLIAGSINEDNPTGILLVNNTWNKNDANELKPGESVELIFKSPLSDMKDKRVKVKISAILGKNFNVMYPHQATIFMSFDTFYSLLNYDINSLNIFIKDKYNLNIIKNELDNICKKYNLGLRVNNNQEIKKTKDLGQLERVIFAFSIIILSLSILDMVLYNKYIASVRQKEFSIMSVLGINDASIRCCLFLESLLSSTISIITASILSILICKFIYIKTNIFPINLVWSFPLKSLCCISIVVVVINIFILFIPIYKFRSKSLIDMIKNKE